MFEKGTREKVRFDYRGVCTMEDLYDLGVKDLDAIYKTLNAKLKQSQEDSLLTTQTKEDAMLKLKLDIVKHIVEVKLREAAEKQQERQNKEKRQKLSELIAAKEDAELLNKSAEELKQMRDALL